MAITREEIDIALFDKLQKVKDDGDVKTFSRTLKAFADVAPVDQPALFISKTNEATSQDKGSPRLKTSLYDLYIYTNTGQKIDVVHATKLNNLMDKIDAVLAPDPVTLFQELGGKVSHAWIEGDTEISEGQLQEQAVAVIPVKILWNQDNNVGKGQFWFDSGSLWARPLIDGQRVPQADTTPIRLGNLKGIELDIAMDLNFPGTQLQYKVNAATGDKEIRGSAQLGAFSSRAINQLYFPNQAAAGARLVLDNGRSAVPGSPFQITPTVPQSGTWESDLGVCFTDDGTVLKRVPATPAAGEYSVSAGVYTFNLLDTTKEVSISFVYDISGGEKVTVANQFKDLSASFEIILQGRYNNLQVTWILNKCVADAFSLPSTTESFLIQDFEFEAIADLSGNVGTVSQG